MTHVTISFFNNDDIVISSKEEKLKDKIVFDEKEMIIYPELTTIISEDKVEEKIKDVILPNGIHIQVIK